MRAYCSVKFDKSLTGQKFLPVVGDFILKMPGGKEYSFGFMETEMFLDDKDDHLVHYRLKSEDMMTFPDIEKMRQCIENAAGFSDFYVDAEVCNGVCLCRATVEQFVLEDNKANRSDTPESTRNVDVTDLGGVYRYEFSKCFLKNTYPTVACSL